MNVCVTDRVDPLSSHNETAVAKQTADETPHKGEVLVTSTVRYSRACHGHRISFVTHDAKDGVVFPAVLVTQVEPQKLVFTKWPRHVPVVSAVSNDSVSSHRWQRDPATDA